MKNVLVLGLIVFNFLILKGQKEYTQIQNYDGVSIYFISDSLQAVCLAQADIRTENINLFLQGGFASIVYSSDSIFEFKYSLRLDDFGCVAPDEEIVTAYNQFIFQYLNKTYGTK